jgi:hypothetical protein
VSLAPVPIMQAEALEFVANFHRHNKPPCGSMLQVGASDGDRLVGVGLAGLPVARLMMDGSTLEVTRCCVLDDAPKGTCSFIYNSLWRAARALSWRRLITYTLASESGASLRGAGWKVIAELAPRRDAQQWTNRPGREWQAVVGQQKLRWEVAA